MKSFTFSASLTNITTSYDVNIALQDDDDFEGNEGFILYFDFDQNEINPADFGRLETGTKTILVTIVDSDGCK